VNDDPRRKLPTSRGAKDDPARPYNRPAGAKLLDVPGLLIVLGLAVAGFIIAVLVTRHAL
jgi:hypothetical protein